MGAIAAAAKELHGVFEPDADGMSLDDLMGPMRSDNNEA